MSYSKDTVRSFCEQPLVYDVCSDLKAFTGLADEELEVRLRRIGRFHFEGEHDFWNPITTSELAWYYTTSVDYLFANAIHVADSKRLKLIIDNKLEPVLDYSGGVGNNVLHLADTHGLSVQYFGIGLAEYSFAQYRIRSRRLTDKVSFLLPYNSATGYKFDPVNGPLPRNGSLGAILAIDVLEHIPNYHIVVQAMVDSIRVGGVIAEVSPFSKDASSTDIADSVHLSNGGISMQDAMGPRMVFNEKAGVWIKVME
jgi:SAM-dependent methyltransferase